MPAKSRGEKNKLGAIGRLTPKIARNSKKKGQRREIRPKNEHFCERLRVPLSDFLDARRKLLTTAHSEDASKYLKILVYRHLFRFFELIQKRPEHFLYDKPKFAGLYVTALQVSQIVSWGSHQSANMVNELLDSIREISGYHPKTLGKSKMKDEAQGLIDHLVASSHLAPRKKIIDELVASANLLYSGAISTIRLRGPISTTNDHYIESCLRNDILAAANYGRKSV